MWYRIPGRAKPRRVGTSGRPLAVWRLARPRRSATGATDRLVTRRVAAMGRLPNSNLLVELPGSRRSVVR